MSQQWTAGIATKSGRKWEAPILHGTKPNDTTAKALAIGKTKQEAESIADSMVEKLNRA